MTAPEARAKFAAAWGVLNLPDQPGLMLPQMLEGLVSGRVKTMWIFGGNLANTEPDIRHVEHCLSSAEFLIAQDIFPHGLDGLSFPGRQRQLAHQPGLRSHHAHG